MSFQKISSFDAGKSIPLHQLKAEQAPAKAKIEQKDTLDKAPAQKSLVLEVQAPKKSCFKRLIEWICNRILCCFFGTKKTPTQSETAPNATVPSKEQKTEETTTSKSCTPSASSSKVDEGKRSSAATTHGSSKGPSFVLTDGETEALFIKMAPNFVTGVSPYDDRVDKISLYLCNVRAYADQLSKALASGNKAQIEKWHQRFFHEAELGKKLKGIVSIFSTYVDTDMRKNLSVEKLMKNKNSSLDFFRSFQRLSCLILCRRGAYALADMILEKKINGDQALKLFDKVSVSTRIFAEQMDRLVAKGTTESDSSDVRSFMKYVGNSKIGVVAEEIAKGMQDDVNAMIANYLNKQVAALKS